MVVATDPCSGYGAPMLAAVTNSGVWIVLGAILLSLLVLAFIGYITRDA